MVSAGVWRALLFLAALAIGTLGWGYWMVSTHGALIVGLYDVALSNDGQAYGPVLAADVEFKDASGAILAKGRAEKPLGIFSIEHPVVGDCRREERAAWLSEDGKIAWKSCFETQSRWFVTWVRRVRSAGVRAGNCRIDQTPVSLTESRYQWWLWWVPLPHIGGDPYTYFELKLWIDSSGCAPAVEPLRDQR